MFSRLRQLIVPVLACVAVGFIAFFVGRESQSADERVIPGYKDFVVFGEAPSRAVMFSGSWQIEGPDKVAFEAQRVDYSCYENEGVCRSAEATVYGDSLVLSTAGHYNVSWEPTRVIITDDPGALACRVSTTIVDLITREVVSLTRDADRRSEACASLPSLKEPRKARLVDGAQRFFDRRRGR